MKRTRRRRNSAGNFLGAGPARQSFFLAVVLLLTGMAVIFYSRPSNASQFEGPELTPKGEFLLELNATVEREENSTEDVTTYLFPQPTLYIGVLSNFEFQLESDAGVVISPDGGESEFTGSDFVIKGKVGLTSENGWVPQSAVFAVISFPTGGKAVTSDGVDPTVSYLASWGLSHDMALTLNVGFGGPTNGPDESNRFFEFSSVVTLEFPLVGELGGFVEYFNAIGNENEPDQHSMDAGLSFQLAKNLSAEFTGGAGLVEAAPDYFFSAQLGISF